MSNSLVKNIAKDIATIEIPNFIKLVNQLPIGSKVTLGTEGNTKEYTAFSSCIKTDPNLVKCPWTVMYEMNAVRSDGVHVTVPGGMIALDEVSGIIVKDGVQVMVSSEYIIVSLPKTKQLSCMCCTRTLHESVCVCNGCGFACYCNEACAKKAWVYWHSVMCDSVKRMLTSEAPDTTKPVGCQFPVVIDAEFLKSRK